MTRYLIVLFAMAAVIAAPMILRPAASVRTEDYAERDRLVIITPHVETLRYEIERAFFHCSRAILRSELWKSETWGDPMKISYGKIYAQALGKPEIEELFDTITQERENDLWH